MSKHPLAVQIYHRETTPRVEPGPQKRLLRLLGRLLLLRRGLPRGRRPTSTIRPYRDAISTRTKHHKQLQGLVPGYR
jgi:hypothetical protein